MLPTGIVIALDSEARLFAGRAIPRNKPFQIGGNLVFVCGMGAETAKNAADVLIKSGVKGLVSWGTVGSLSPDLTSGDLFLPDRICSEKQSFEADQRWLLEIRKALGETHLRSACLFSSSVVLKNKLDKEKAHQSYSADAVDMESIGVAESAHSAGLQFIVIRSVVDEVDQTLPVAATQSVDQFGKVQFPKLIKNLLKAPGSILELMKLGRQFKQASQTLAYVQAEIPEPGRFLMEKASETDR